MALAFPIVVPAFAQGAAGLLIGTVKDVNGGNDDGCRRSPFNTGLYVGQPGDQRTVGVTLRLSFTR